MEEGFIYLSIPALGPTQPPMQWVSGFSLGKEAGTCLDHPPISSAEVKERVEL